MKFPKWKLRRSHKNKVSYLTNWTKSANSRKTIALVDRFKSLDSLLIYSLVFSDDGMSSVL